MGGLYAAYIPFKAWDLSTVLPNFLVVGAAKSGTTTLYRLLKQHPDVFMSPVKEPYYFTFHDRPHVFRGPADRKTNEREIIRDRVRYEALFDGWRGQQRIGECSNSYLYYRHTAEVIRREIPTCLIVIILRDPVQRAFSHWLQMVMLDHERLSFEDALEAEEERESAGWRWHYQYIKQGMYYQQVRQYFKVFDNEQVLVLLFDELRDAPRRLARRLYHFLGVDPEFQPKTRVHNPSGLPRNQLIHRFLRHENAIRKYGRLVLPARVRRAGMEYLQRLNYAFDAKPKLSAETARRLAGLFREDVEHLEQILGRSLEQWLV